VSPYHIVYRLPETNYGKDYFQGLQTCEDLVEGMPGIKAFEQIYSNISSQIVSIGLEALI
jgi:hypothetical protein